MSKKLISIILSLGITASLLAGCSGQTAAQSSSAEAEQSADAATETQETGTAADAATSETEAQAQAAAAQTDAAEAGATTAADADTATSEVDFTTGTPWICSFADGAITADTETNLKDDFYLAANKDDILGLQIPEGFSSAGTVPDVILKNNEDIKNLFTS